MPFNLLVILINTLIVINFAEDLRGNVVPVITYCFLFCSMVTNAAYRYLETTKLKVLSF